MTRAQRFGALAVSAGLVWLCTGSPLAQMDHQFLTVHMLKHLVLMTIAAPLLLCAAPAPLPPLRLEIGWFAGALTVVGWHVPAAFELGMQSPAWHALQEVSFLAAGVLFWWPVAHAWSSGTWSLAIPVYLFLAALPCDTLSAFLVFCDRVVYPTYLSGHHPHVEMTALQDQACAGALMWVWATFAYLVPAVIGTLRSINGSRQAMAASARE